MKKKFVEKPIAINGVTLNSFEEFCEYVLKRQVSTEEAYQRILKRLKAFEEKYGMTSEQFAKEIKGTPAEDDPDFLKWGMDYDTYLKLKKRIETGCDKETRQKPITINGVTLNSFEEFCDYVLKRQVSTEEAYQYTLERLKEFEKKYGMTSEQFAKKIKGTPAEDDPDFLKWGMEYDSYVKLKEKLEQK